MALSFENTIDVGLDAKHISNAVELEEETP
jgi:hypothetical protein